MRLPKARLEQVLARFHEVEARMSSATDGAELVKLGKEHAEVRAGTGGDEAALFAGDLFRMYQRYAQQHGWRVEVESESEGEMGGFKEIIASITGDGGFGRSK